MHNQSMIRECLTEKEITDCLEEVLAALPTEDQVNIKRVQKRLGQIRGLGHKGLLQLLFSVDQAPNLAKLNETLKGG